MNIRRSIAVLLIALCSVSLQGPVQADHKITPQEYLRFEEGMRCFVQKDYEGALGCWMPLAQVGVAEAQYNIGRMYAYGEGVAIDYVESYAWFIVAARNGRVAQGRRAMDELKPHISADQISRAYRRADAIELMILENTRAPGS